ncbi:DMT family transporter [Hydrogenophaga sp. IBVHS2]|uniref:DMT family transporter n=1 Tax=Hydrogenophaga sp. IBVHS2 TaxID=1985170 RepID=UPI000A2EAB01|nr:DMT family transporter [Hydrogenophaga sp. IBVHS2]OSZ63334.1 EamA family transporter [Hydrogenophaga sp. IBVHS2]
MDHRQPLDGRATGFMLLLCLLWSAQQIVLKATAEDFSPVLQIAVRSGIAAALVGLLMAWRGERLDVSGGVWQPGAAAGALFALEYLLVGEGLRHTSAAHMIVFLYTAPVFAALGLHMKLPSERLAPLQWAGIALAFAGIALAFLGRDASMPGDWRRMLWGDALGLLAGMAWGATTVVIRTTKVAALPATQTLLYQLLGAFVLLLPAALLTGHTTFRPTPAVLTGLAFQAVVVSFASFLLWFWLLRHYLASRLGVFSFLTPVFGVLLGAWLLAEPIEPGFLLGALLVLAGVVLVSGHGWISSLRAGRAGPDGTARSRS